MTTEDFIFILVEAFAHQDPKEFFRSRQKLWHKREKYSREGFNDGLLKTFKWLNNQVHQPDRRRCEIKLPDGQILNEFIRDEEHHKELRSKGELSFPWQNFILVCRSSDQKAILLLNSESLHDLWRHLFKYLNPYCNEFLPPPPMLEEEDLLFDGPVETMVVPENISCHFPPLIDEDALPDEQPMLALTESAQSLKPFLNITLPVNFKLTLRQAALILYYSGSIVTRENGEELARHFGHTSGEKLYQHFTYYSNTTDRRGALETDLKTKNKIELIKSILSYLSDKGREAAKKDVAIIEKMCRYSD